jgi:protein involved in polysaccharide export with SLBB domain
MQRILLPILVLAAPSPGRSQEVRPSGADSAAADRLRPGDNLRLRIWRGPELSGEFPSDRINAHLARDTRLSELQIRSGDQLYVPERGWLSRNTALAAAGLTASASLIVTLLLR